MTAVAFFGGSLFACLYCVPLFDRMPLTNSEFKSSSSHLRSEIESNSRAVSCSSFFLLVDFQRRLWPFHKSFFLLFLQQSNQPKPTSSSSTSGNTHSSSLSGGRRPVKVWNAARTVRKAFVVSTYDEFHRKGREKLGLGKVEPVRVVLEADGTQV